MFERTEGPTLEPVGKIEYAFSGETRTFYTTEEYLQEYEEAIDLFGVVGGFKATTITRDPATRKAVDDLVYGAFGEENPYGLDHYQEKCETPQIMEVELDEELEL